MEKYTIAAICTSQNPGSSDNNNNNNNNNKLLTGVVSESMYNFLDKNNLLPEEQKGCCKGSRGTKDQLLIDKMILQDCNRKAYDMVPHSWIIECLDLLKIADNIRGFITESMKGWQTNLISSVRYWGMLKFEEASLKVIVCHRYCL